MHTQGGVKDLEVMFTNVIQMACDCTPCITARAELLEGFELMAKRDSVRRFVEKKTSEFYALYNAEINLVKKLFDTVSKCNSLHCQALPRAHPSHLCIPTPCSPNTPHQSKVR